MPVMVAVNPSFAIPGQRNLQHVVPEWPSRPASCPGQTNPLGLTEGHERIGPGSSRVTGGTWPAGLAVRRRPLRLGQDGAQEEGRDRALRQFWRIRVALALRR